MRGAPARELEATLLEGPAHFSRVIIVRISTHDTRRRRHRAMDLPRWVAAVRQQIAEAHPRQTKPRAWLAWVTLELAAVDSRTLPFRKLGSRLAHARCRYGLGPVLFGSTVAVRLVGLIWASRVASGFRLAAEELLTALAVWPHPGWLQDRDH